MLLWLFVILLVLFVIAVLALYLEPTGTFEHIPVFNNVVDKTAKNEIPKTVMISHKHKKTLENNSNTKQLVKLNPTYQFNFFGDKECEAFISEHYTDEHLKLFKFLKHGAIRCDWFRTLYLHTTGGLYIDFDVQAFNFEEHVPTHSEHVFFPITKSSKKPNPAFIACYPGHKFLKSAIESYLGMFRTNIPYQYWDYSIVNVFSALIFKGGWAISPDAWVEDCNNIGKHPICSTCWFVNRQNMRVTQPKKSFGVFIIKK
jgi:hypothetical protein